MNLTPSGPNERPLLIAMKNIAERKMARRTPCWHGPGDATTESPLLVIPDGRIPDSFVDTFNTWLDEFNERCIAAGHSATARITVGLPDEKSCKLRAES